MATSRGASTKSRATFGILGLLVLTGLALGPSSLAGAHFASHVSAAPAAASHAAGFAPMVRPASATGAAFVNLTDAALPAWSTPGSVWVNFSVETVNASFTQDTANVSVEMVAEITSGGVVTDVPFASWAVPVVGSAAHASENFSTSDSSSNVLGNSTHYNTSNWVAPAGQWLANGKYFFVVFFSDFSSLGFPVHAYNTTALAGNAHPDTTVYVASHTAWMALDAPVVGSTIAPGPETIVASFGGDWVISANLNITNPSGVVVAFANLSNVQSDPSWVENHTNLLVTTNAAMIQPGLYTATMNITFLNSAGMQAHNTTTATFSVTNASSVETPVYVNTTYFDNNSGSAALIGGLSPGAGAAVLMVVGLIVGMLVALILSRMMTPTSTAPAQAWSGTKASNECPVCHQSFPSEAELKEHSKSAHGM